MALIIRAASIVAVLGCLAAWSWGQGDPPAPKTPAAAAASGGAKAPDSPSEGAPRSAARKFTGLDAAGASVGKIEALALSADAGTVLAGCEDGRLHVWQVQTGKVRTLIYPDRPTTKPVASAPAPTSASASTSAPAEPAVPAPQPGGPPAVAPGAARGARAARAPAPAPPPPPADPRRLYRIAISPDGNLAAACDARGIHLWNLPEGKYLGKLDVAGTRRISFSGDNRQLTTVGGDNVQVAWNLADRSAAAKAELVKHVMPIPVIPRVIDEQQEDLGEYIAFLWVMEGPLQFRAGMHLYIVDTDGDRTVQDYTVTMSNSANSGALALSHSGRYVAVSANDTGRFAVFDLGAMSQARDVKAHDNPVTALCYSGDDKWLVSADVQGVIIVWTASELKPAGGKPWARDLCWTNLANDMPMGAILNIWPLVDGGDQTTTFLRDRLVPAGDMDRQELAKILADLDSDTFSVRKDAREKLAARAQANWPLLQETLGEKLSTEVRTTLEGLLSKVDLASPIQEKYAVRVLERIDTPAARDLLRSMAALKEGSNLGKYARAGLARMAPAASTQPATSSR